ncbi:hypothetical protein KKF69_04445 [Patescibacteria group bacterium]|nr:hypothetical protein [Patescibacteria group bacterium]MBU4016699.1 hypothetical protein [Patescibacteria group bacterium]
MKSLLHRTQIYLPKDLREEIDQQRYSTGESLAEYLRKAAEERLRREKKKKVDLKKFADEIIGMIKPGKEGWGGVNLEEWRKERQEEDDHWIKRWDEAVRLVPPKRTS